MKNVEASIRARLTQKAKERGITFQYASILYMQEGLLARIAGSSYSGKLILKATSENNWTNYSNAYIMHMWMSSL